MSVPRSRLLFRPGARPGSTVVLAATVMALVVAVFPATSAQAAAVSKAKATVAKPTTVTDKPDLYSAMVAARTQGSAVLVDSQESPTSQTWANADGTLTTESDPGPARERLANGSWANIDTTLATVAGALVPKVSAVPMEFSVGGTTLVASEQTPQGVAQLGWDSPLPIPTVSGNTATYPSVRPGVDLVMHANRLGFEVSFVLHGVPAAAVSLPLTLTLRGFSAARQADGSLKITDSKGKLAGVGGAPVMFGAAVDTASQQPTKQQTVPGMLSAGTSASVTPIGGVTFPGSGSGTQQTWTLSPAGAFLADPSLTYPVTIDPSLNFIPSSSTYVQTGVTTSQYTNTELAPVFHGVDRFGFLSGWTSRA